MRREGIDLIAPSSDEHVYYTSGFPVYQYTFEPETVAFSLIPADEHLEPYLVIPHFTRMTLLQCPTWISNVLFFGKEYYISGAPDIPGRRLGTVYQALARAVAELGMHKGRIGIEMDRLPVGAYNSLREELPDAEFVDGRDVLQNTRSVKTPEEILRLEKAAGAVEKAITAAFAAARPGMTELDLDRVIRHTLLEEGCTTNYVQVGTGTRGAFGPVYPSEAAIEKGDLIRIDASAKFERYLSDICRMAVLGEPTGEMKEIYSAVFMAEMEAIQIVKPGVRVSDIYSAAVKVPGTLGLQDFHRNNIGHSIGLVSHEHPILSPESDCIIEAGMVLCVEVPYYRWKVGGFAPEDEILVTPDGYRLITHPQQELIVI